MATSHVPADSNEAGPRKTTDEGTGRGAAIIVPHQSVQVSGKADLQAGKVVYTMDSVRIRQTKPP